MAARSRRGGAAESFGATQAEDASITVHEMPTSPDTKPDGLFNSDISDMYPEFSS
jgi:hypothetical protein